MPTPVKVCATCAYIKPFNDPDDGVRYECHYNPPSPFLIADAITIHPVGKYVVVALDGNCAMWKQA